VAGQAASLAATSSPQAATANEMTKHHDKVTVLNDSSGM
jgi:hypothetical protein